MLDKINNFTIHHTRIVLGLVGLLVILYVAHIWINRSYDTALAKNAVAQNVLEQQIAKNADLEKQQQAREQAYQNLVDNLTKQNQTLVSGIVARNQAVQTQQKTDATLPMPELAARQEQLAGVTGVKDTGNGLLESPPAAIVITQKLESLPALEQNVKDQQTEIDNKDKQIGGLNGVVTGLGQQVEGCKVQITDTQKACEAQVKLEQAKGRKKLITGAKIGAAVVSILAFIILHH